MTFLARFVGSAVYVYSYFLPWSVELDEDLLGAVEHDVIEVGGDEHLDGLGGPVLRQLLAQQVLLQRAREERLHEFLGTIVILSIQSMLI